MSQTHNCPCAPECVLQGALNTIGGKWKLPILCSLLSNGASRYNELLKNTRGISNTMLSKTLKELEDDGLVKRSEYLEVPIRVWLVPGDKLRGVYDPRAAAAVLPAQMAALFHPL